MAKERPEQEAMVMSSRLRGSSPFCARYCLHEGNQYQWLCQKWTSASSYSGQSQISRRGHWKRGFWIKLSKIDFQICYNFVQSSCNVRPETPILCKFRAQFATNLRNTPLTNAPFSGFLRQAPTTQKGIMLGSSSAWPQSAEIDSLSGLKMTEELWDLLGSLPWVLRLYLPWFFPCHFGKRDGKHKKKQGFVSLPNPWHP